MKHLAKFQIKCITGTIFVLFLLTNFNFTFAQRNQNNDRTRVVQNQNNIEVMRIPNPNDPDLLSVSASDEQLFTGGRNGFLRFFDIPAEGGKLGIPGEVPMPKIPYPLRQISFTDYADFVLKGNTIYKPTKTGTWTVNYSYMMGGNLSPEFWSMDFADPSSACIVGVNLKKSGAKEIVDSGLVICNHNFKNNQKAWLPPILPDEFNDGKINSQLTSISFHNNNGWLVGANGIIWKTENSGRNWKVEQSNTDNPLLNVHAVDENNVWAIGFDSTVLRRVKIKSKNPQPNKNRQNPKQSDRKGNSETDPKTEENNKETGTLEKVQQKGKEAIEDLRNRRVPGLSTPTPTPTPITTTGQKEKEPENLDDENEVPEENNKTEWLPLEDNPLGSQMVRLWGVKFAPNKRDGWIIGDSGVILHTKNGGLKWDRVSLVDAQKKPLFNTVAPNFYAMHVDNNFCWIVGSQGVILRIRY